MPKVTKKRVNLQGKTPFFRGTAPLADLQSAVSQYSDPNNLRILRYPINRGTTIPISNTCIKRNNRNSKYQAMKNSITSTIAAIAILLITGCSKDPVNQPQVDPTTMKITSATDFTGADGDTTSFKFIPLNSGGGVVNNATVSWTNDNTSIGLAASGSGSIPTFTLKNKGTTNAVAHIVATPILNGVKGIPLTVTVIVTAAGNTFTMLNSLPLSTGIIPYHWYADAGKLYWGGTPKLYFNTPSDTSALYYGEVHKNNLAGQLVNTFGPGGAYNFGGQVNVNMQDYDTSAVVFKITKSDPSVYPTSLKVNFIDNSLNRDKVLGGNTASYGALNDSLIVDLSQKVVVTGQFTKIDKSKPLTIYSFNTGGINTDYYAIPYRTNRFLKKSSQDQADVTVTLTLSDGTRYQYVIVYGTKLSYYF